MIKQHQVFLIFIKMLRQLMSFCVLIAVPWTSIFAQRTITGNISNGEEPLIGVTILVKPSLEGTTSDYNGDFVLKNLPNETVSLAISYTGYTTVLQEVPATQSTINITMESDPYQLEDIIVTANKKEQTIQTTPLAITAISPVQLRRTGAKQFRDFARRDAIA